MMRLPEKIRRVLEKIVKELASKEDICGIGLFGSWSRGDAATTSDVDLLILTKSDVTDEYIERTAANGIMIDFDFIPMRWTLGPLPPELDQKLFEAQILYDRDWRLTNIKMLMAKAYSSPERVEIRTNAHATEADIHLSRATSAMSKGDFLSAHLFARTAMENALKIPLEIALQPISNSRFVEKVETAVEKLGLKEMFKDYMEIAGLTAVDKTQVEEKLKLFKALWDDMYFTVKQHAQTVEKAHFKLKTNIRYYFNPLFVQGTVLRATSMINAGNLDETAHYLDSIFISILENYAWLKSTLEKQRINHTTLIRSIENLEKTNPKVYNEIVSFLGIANTDKALATETVEKAKRNITRLHKEKKHLIKTYISKN
ncbi:MAG: nucleotidyltransferase domain-containing protein [Candidatus Bathyarchaeia archaeon]